MTLLWETYMRWAASDLALSKGQTGLGKERRGYAIRLTEIPDVEKCYRPDIFMIVTHKTRDKGT